MKVLFLPCPINLLRMKEGDLHYTWLPLSSPFIFRVWDSPLQSDLFDSLDAHWRKSHINQLNPHHNDTLVFISDRRSEERIVSYNLCKSSLHSLWRTLILSLFLPFRQLHSALSWVWLSGWLDEREEKRERKRDRGRIADWIGNDWGKISLIFSLLHQMGPLLFLPLTHFPSLPYSLYLSLSNLFPPLNPSSIHSLFIYNCPSIISCFFPSPFSPFHSYSNRSSLIQSVHSHIVQFSPFPLSHPLVPSLLFPFSVLII